MERIITAYIFLFLATFHLLSQPQRTLSVAEKDSIIWRIATQKVSFKDVLYVDNLTNGHLTFLLSKTFGYNEDCHGYTIDMKLVLKREKFLGTVPIIYQFVSHNKDSFRIYAKKSGGVHVFYDDTLLLNIDDTYARRDVYYSNQNNYKHQISLFNQKGKVLTSSRIKEKFSHSLYSAFPKHPFHSDYYVYKSDKDENTYYIDQIQINGDSSNVIIYNNYVTLSYDNIFGLRVIYASDITNINMSSRYFRAIADMCNLFCKKHKLSKVIFTIPVFLKKSSEGFALTSQ